jgi:hypothetical protein
MPSSSDEAVDSRRHRKRAEPEWHREALGVTSTACLAFSPTIVSWPSGDSRKRCRADLTGQQAGPFDNARIDELIVAYLQTLVTIPVLTIAAHWHVNDVNHPTAA